MTETNKLSKDVGTAADKANQIWGDFIPTIGFVLTYNVLRRVNLFDGLVGKDTALYWATGILIALMLGVIVRQTLRGQRVSPMLLLSSGIVGGFGLIGILLQEKAFIYVKPTIQQFVMAGIILVPIMFGRNFWQTLFSNVFDLPDEAWRTLAIRWGFFFIVMALWNEYLWRTYAPGLDHPLVLLGIPIAPAGSYEFLGLTFGAKNAEDVWANWKLGNMGLFFLFGALNVPYTLKHLREPEAAEAPDA